MKRFSTRANAIVFALATLFLTAQIARPAGAAITLSELQSIDGQSAFHPISGEEILLSGDVYILIIDSSNASGSFHSFTTRYIGVTGVGITSGINYQITGGITDIAIVAEDTLPAAFYFTDVTRFIAQGPADDIQVLNQIIQVFDNEGNLLVDINRSETTVI